MADPTALEEVRSVLEARKDELIRTYGAEGVGIGKSTSGEGYAIVVYLATPEQLRTEESIDGIPVRFEVTGQFRALS